MVLYYDPDNQSTKGKPSRSTEGLDSDLDARIQEMLEAYNPNADPVPMQTFGPKDGPVQTQSDLAAMMGEYGDQIQPYLLRSASQQAAPQPRTDATRPTEGTPAEEPGAPRPLPSKKQPSRSDQFESQAGHALGKEAGKQATEAVVGAATESAVKAPTIEIARRIGEEGAKAAAEGGAKAATEAGGKAVADQAGKQAADAGLSAADVAKWAAIAYEAYMVYDLWSDDSPYVSDETKMGETAKRVGLAVADYYTAGLASLAYAGLSTMKEFRKAEEEISSAVGLNRKTTKQYQAERFKESWDNAASEEDQKEIAFFWDRKQKGWEGGNTIQPDGPADYELHNQALAGRSWNWEEEKNTVIDGSQLMHHLGFIQAFPDWMSGYTDEQREIIAEAALDNDLFTAEKGDVYFAGEDDAAIKAIAAQVVEGTYQPLRTDEQRWADRNAYLQSLQQSEGYESPVLGQSMEQSFYAIELQKAVAAVDKARFTEDPIPEWANQILTVEDGRRKAAEAEGQPWNPNPPTEEEIAMYGLGAQPQQEQAPQEQQQQERDPGRRRPQGPPIPEEPYQTPEAPVLPPPGPPEPEEPTIKSPADFASAYMEVYAQNQPHINRSY